MDWKAYIRLRTSPGDQFSDGCRSEWAFALCDEDIGCIGVVP
jgi:hypothetical protein